MTEPLYWKSSLEEIDEIVKGISKGKALVLGKSAGGRDIYKVEYGAQNDFARRANYNSACGARDISCYKDKKAVKPCIMLIGGIHGNECEGIAALLNLISILETGSDIAGNKNSDFDKIEEKIHLIIIPCANPDGRARVPFKSFVGKNYEEFRYYSQGTWKDGSLCSWPDCKKVHPIKDAVSFLGGYFNDDGVNLMHDNFFLPMAEETRLLMREADMAAPDFILLLHGGDNTQNCMMQPDYTPDFLKDELDRLSHLIKKACEKRGCRYRVQENVRREGNYPPPSFNLTSALHHVCGGLSVTYESNQGIADRDNALGFDEIYLTHLIMFKEIFEFYIRGENA